MNATDEWTGRSEPALGRVWRRSRHEFLGDRRNAGGHQEPAEGAVPSPNIDRSPRGAKRSTRRQGSQKAQHTAKTAEEDLLHRFITLRASYAPFFFSKCLLVLSSLFQIHTLFAISGPSPSIMRSNKRTPFQPLAIIISVFLLSLLPAAHAQALGSLCPVSSSCFGSQLVTRPPNARRQTVPNPAGARRRRCCKSSSRLLRTRLLFLSMTRTVGSLSAPALSSTASPTTVATQERPVSASLVSSFSLASSLSSYYAKNPVPESSCAPLYVFFLPFTRRHRNLRRLRLPPDQCPDHWLPVRLQGPAWAPTSVASLTKTAPRAASVAARFASPTKVCPLAAAPSVRA